MSGRDFTVQNAAWIRAIRCFPGDVARRLRYADWLTTCDDRRGEYIRIYIELATPGLAAERLDELSIRRDALRPTISPFWLLFMGEFVPGVVSNVPLNELFVQVCGLTGSVKITDMSWGSRPPVLPDLWRVGQEVQVALIHWDEKRPRWLSPFRANMSGHLPQASRAPFKHHGQDVRQVRDLQCA